MKRPDLVILKTEMAVRVALKGINDKLAWQDYMAAWQCLPSRARGVWLGIWKLGLRIG
jgi:hypothetical protein